MSLSPLISFKSRFVTYLLNFPRIKMIKYNIVVCCYDKMLVNVATYVIPG